MRIAYILPHKNLTGGMKALLHQMKHLTRKGHVVKAYLRAEKDVKKAIPDWSGLKDSDVARQFVVPPNIPFTEAINDSITLTYYRTRC